MAQTVTDVMTPNPVTFDAGASLQDAARAMRDEDIGDVIVTDGGRACGIVTDRDIAVRAVADGRDPSTRLGDVCSRDVVTVGPDDAVEDAIRVMREHAIRRVLVMDGERMAGVVSLGDLAMERDPNSVLADVSDAPPNN